VQLGGIKRGKLKGPAPNVGSLSHILPSLKQISRIFMLKSNIGCLETVERLLNEQPIGQHPFSPNLQQKTTKSAITLNFFLFAPKIHIFLKNLIFPQFPLWFLIFVLLS
jgi:hypothetical protein